MPDKAMLKENNNKKKSVILIRRAKIRVISGRKMSVRLGEKTFTHKSNFI